MKSKEIEDKAHQPARDREPPSPESDEWNLIDRARRGYASSSTVQAENPVARIVRKDAHPMLYGVSLAPQLKLPPFPVLPSEDSEILQPLPSDEELIQDDSDFRGQPFAVIASGAPCADYCKFVLSLALENKDISPEHYRFAFYLYGRLNLVHMAVQKMHGVSPEETANLKRSAASDDMRTSRNIQVPIQLNPKSPGQYTEHVFEVLMMGDEIEETFALTEDEPPGLAILDSGCTKTMHGKAWGDRLEEELNKLGLSSSLRKRHQVFKGIGGKVESEGIKVFPCGIYGVRGEIHSAETPGSTPLLISRPFMEELGAVIDVDARLCSFKKIGVYDKPLHKTAKGHLAISLLDFGTSGDFCVGGELGEEALKAETEAIMADADPLDYMTAEDRHFAMLDDILDARDELDMWKQDVANYEKEFGPVGSSSVCEDEVLFASLAAEEMIVRKTTSRKGKKIDGMNLTVDGEDFRVKQIITGKNPNVSHKPPVGKTWLKQLFAGQMGLTIMAVMIGMAVGTPLDYVTSSWNANTKEGLKWVQRDLMVEDPYVVVVTHPCGPWGNWSRFNLARGGIAAVTVDQLREEGRPLLKLVNKVVKERVRQKKHVFLEQPLGSQNLDEPEMHDVKDLVVSGALIYIKVDGCMLGYKDRESGHPHKKPSYYLTTMVAAESVFGSYVCDGQHLHQVFEGRNCFGSEVQRLASGRMV